VLTTYSRPDAHLALVGAPRLPRYTASIELLLHELHLPGAWIPGRVSDEELAAYYRRADLFVTASEHEGFCAPLLEAMAFGVPVLARSFAAVPETAGDAAVLLDPDDGPLVMAEAMDEMLGDKALRDDLVARGRRRVQDFNPEASRATVLQHLLDMV
jgi:glycosyltransferase involved in cell wall biosynthesis